MCMPLKYGNEVAHILHFFALKSVVFFVSKLCSLLFFHHPEHRAALLVAVGVNIIRAFALGQD